MKPSTMSEQVFMDVFGGVYEHSPWVAQSAWQSNKDRSIFDTPAGLASVLSAAMAQGTEPTKLALICAHPDLAGKAAMANTLTVHSKSEQSGVGLNQCTPEEFAELNRLNTAYRQRFDFPFIIAVKGHTVPTILQAFEQRIEHTKEEEIHEALRQINQIATFRIEEIFT